MALNRGVHGTVAPIVKHCPVCGGEGFVLGALWRRFWWRCRDCGIDFSTKVEVR